MSDFIFVSLHYKVDGFQELSGSGYERCLVNDPEICNWFYIAEKDDDVKFKNNVDIEFLEATKDWGTVSSIGIWSNLKDGELFFINNLKHPVIIKKKDKFKIKINDIKDKGYLAKKKKKKKLTIQEKNFNNVRFIMKIIEKAKSKTFQIRNFEKINNLKIQQLLKKKTIK